VDFGGESAVSLIDRYENLLVTQTFSKSRSMAGARLGFAIGNEDLISDLHTLRYSTNPYNVNRMTSAAGIAALVENEYYMENCKKIMETRELVKCRLESMGFFVIPSKTNFLFISHPCIDGSSLYLRLKEKGVLVRHFDKDRIRQYNRVTIGTPKQMETFLETTKKIMEGTP
jgi:histidinol-phosphate aminotransferase